MRIIRPFARCFGPLAACVWLAFATAARAGDPTKGKSIYDGRCAFCHGASGKGDGVAGAALKPPATNFATPDFWQNTKLETIKSFIENGKPGTAMMAFKASLSAEQIDDLLAYLQTFKPR